MTRTEFIKKLEELDRMLMEEVETEELCDRAREHAHNFIWNAIGYLEDNEDDGGW